MKIYIPFIILAYMLSAFPVRAKAAPSPLEKAPRTMVRNLDGFLKAELDGTRVILEMPRSMLGDTILMVCHHDGYDHDYKQVVWTQQGNGILLEAVRTVSVTGIIIPMDSAPKDSSIPLATFPITKETTGSRAVFIDVTELFLKVDLGWDLGNAIRDLSYISSVANLDNETIISTTRSTSNGKVKRSIQVDFSFYRLTEPMAPRLFDHRVGFYCEDKGSTISYRLHDAKAAITRWRLEKKHPEQAISSPIKPITFTLTEDIPKKWRPYVRAGILAWLPAFETAGFKDAIMVNDPFTKDADILGSSTDHAMVRWRRHKGVRGFEAGGGATVSSVIDLRSGEILKSDIIINSSVQRLADEYFIRCAPLDERARQYPFPDDLMGGLIQSLVSHETGHALGLMDAHYGEFAYPLGKLRDPDWLERMGHTPSIMSYARHNGLPQPEDGIPPSLLLQKVGPMDTFNIRWGYTPYQNTDFRSERHFLDMIVREQDSIPWFRYNKYRGETIGPGSTNEVVESSDPIGGTALALKNLERTLDILSAISKRERDFALAERLYDKVLNLWRLQLAQVMSMVGGYSIQYKSPSQKGNIYTPIPYSEQMEALDFLLQQTLSPPEWLVCPKALKRTRYSTHPDLMLEMQTRLLYELLDYERLKRLEYLEHIETYDGITEAVLQRLQHAIFKKFFDSPETMATRDMALQDFYVDRVLQNLEQRPVSINAEKNRFVHNTRSKALFLAQLVKLRKRVSDNLDQCGTEAARGHAMRLLKLMEDL
ncbi:zinc-dependent metalloprotease [Flavisericum labens]|uniref:zinc-dependent metalloprotease n=1 Tax=Flavisericum labens TaxID=3377112 RepID=UPI00387B0872